MTKAEKTRQYIIEKTAPIFNVKGIAATSLNDMTGATGLTKGSIYGNFANKDEVALAAFEHNRKQMFETIRSEMSARNSAKDKLMVFADYYGDFLNVSFPTGGCPILNTSTEADDTHPALKEKAAAAITSWKELIVSLIREGIKTDEFRENDQIEAVAISLVALIEGGIMIGRVTGKLNYRNHITNTIRKMIEELA